MSLLGTQDILKSRKCDNVFNTETLFYCRNQQMHNCEDVGAIQFYLLHRHVSVTLVSYIKDTNNTLAIT